VYLYRAINKFDKIVAAIVNALSKTGKYSENTYKHGYTSIKKETDVRSVYINIGDTVTTPRQMQLVRSA